MCHLAVNTVTEPQQHVVSVDNSLSLNPSCAPWASSKEEAAFICASASVSQASSRLLEK